jgi:hypothetical protein
VTCQCDKDGVRCREDSYTGAEFRSLAMHPASTSGQSSRRLRQSSAQFRSGLPTQQRLHTCRDCELPPNLGGLRYQAEN